MTSAAGDNGGASAEELGDAADHLKEFMKGVAEMSVELAKGCRDIVMQNLLNENSFLVKYLGKDSYIVSRIRGPYEATRERLKRFNDYLPEDKNPVHAWSVICIVVVLALAAVIVNTEPKASAPSVKKVSFYPPVATRVLLPDGRYMAFYEQGVPVDRARFSIISPHTFLSSRLAGIPGLKDSLLEEFGIRFITYDLPGFGESDPHNKRNLESSAWDISFLADALEIKDKFWVVGYSSGSMHSWAALRYIPDRVAGAAMFAPMVNPYDPLMNKEERRGIWNKWTRKRKFMLFLARRFPRFLSYFYHRSFLSGKHGQMDKWLSLSLGIRDRALIQDPVYEEFWQRDVEESIRQGSPKPFMEEASLQVSNWGFSLTELKLQKKLRGNGILDWLWWLSYLIIGKQEELTGFLGPIHIWQGMDDQVVPPSMTDFVHRILPGVAIHKLPYEGHFTYFCFCHECHRQIFTTLFGTPQGPLKDVVAEEIPTENETENKEKEEPELVTDAAMNKLTISD
ncbi:hypothetical protein SAY87_016639 [Trapa incisa]|uniref:AB hydrolase-1 domain-containing protein n=1 Tax=Trapa incisa TaxID=236973 RepID=A0AAN7LCT5_9MYRT|nr:hypothetical protein SAY87_016639 [Trapa incisa]